MTDTEVQISAPAIEQDPVATRNKLLRVMRQVVEIKAGIRFMRSIPEDASKGARPASYFVGVDIEIDLQRLADELVTSVDELARILKLPDQPSPV
jgi:hypothetical protein